MAVARGSLLLLALVACAWFALGIQQARDTDQATALLSSQARLSPATASRVRSLLASAGTLNPDTAIDLLRGRLATVQHDPAQAVRILAAATRREPLNLQAWVALAQAELHGSSALMIERAAAAIGRLAPSVK